MTAALAYSVEIKTPASEAPVSLAVAKAHLRVLHANEDTLIGALIAVATEHIEHRLSRSLVTRTLTLALDAFPCGQSPLTLRAPPVSAVASFKYWPVSGAEITFGSDDYQLVRGGLVCELSPAPGVSWPATSERRRAVTVEYIAGYGNAAAVPKAIVHAILLLVEHLYQNRSAVADVQKITVPLAVESLLGPHTTTGWI